MISYTKTVKCLMMCCSDRLSEVKMGRPCIFYGFCYDFIWVIRCFMGIKLPSTVISNVWWNNFKYF